MAMVESGQDKLLSLLFGGERQLSNFKFFPGTDPDLTPDELFGAAHDALFEALSGGLVDISPDDASAEREKVVSAA